MHQNLFAKFDFYKIIVYEEKLDGVGPVDNRPSTDKLHHLVQKILI